MEEINQNPEVSQIYQAPNQIPQQPSKNWLIKSLLMGILGGIIVGGGIGLFAAVITSFLTEIPPYLGELASLMAAGAGVMIFASLGWLVFFILTLYLNYCYQRGIPLGHKPFLIKFLFLVAGMGWGWLAGIGIQLYLGEFPGISDRTYSFLIRGITSLLGALFFFKLSELFIPNSGEISQSSTQSSSENPSKNWLIKYLLIGILGGIPFGTIMGIIASSGSLYWMSATSKEPLNLGAIAAALVFYEVAPIAATAFFTFTIFIGYRRHVVSYLKTKSSPILVELLFLLIGGAIGHWYLTFMFADFLISLGYFRSIIGEILVFTNISLGAYVLFKFSRLLLRQEAFSSWIKQPLVWVSLVYILLVVIVAPLNWKKNQELSQEGKLLDLNNLQSSVALDDSFGEDWYRIEITAQLLPSPVKNRYQVVAANLDSQTESCPSYGSSSGADIHPGDSQVTITFLKSFLSGSPPEVLPTSCSYDFSYSFDLMQGKYRTGVRKNETGLALHQTITIPFGPQKTSCTQDSDCPEGLVCVGRGPTQPSKEIPGLCVSSKASQVTQ